MASSKKLKEKTIQELLQFSIINIDKPSGPTSFSISDFVRKSLNLSKTSHFGTLDPQVTGVLPVALSRACRLNEYFMHRDKVYVGIMRLHEEIPDKTLKEHMQQFIGKITQLPPVRSRVKREERIREVKTFKFLEREGKDVLFETQVQAGTYIRKLIHDLGENTGGAHMLELRRIKASIFPESQSINLYRFEEAVEEYKKGSEEKLKSILIPAESCILEVMPKVEIKEFSLKSILTGKPLMKSDIQSSSLPDQEIFAVFHKGRFIAIMKKSLEGDILARAQFVLN